MNDFAAHGCGGLVIRGDDGHVPEAGGDLLRGGWRMVGGCGTSTKDEACSSGGREAFNGLWSGPALESGPPKGPGPK